MKPASLSKMQDSKQVASEQSITDGMETITKMIYRECLKKD